VTEPSGDGRSPHWAWGTGAGTNLLDRVGLINNPVKLDDRTDERVARANLARVVTARGPDREVSQLVHS